MPPSVTSHALLRAFDLWRRQNEKGGLPVRWRRRSILVAQLVQKLGVHAVVEAPLFFNEKMYVVTGENTSRSILTFGYTEVALTALMLRIIRPEQTVVDIGTHFGYEALLAARLVGETGRVICFEPHPETARIAHRNLDRLPHVTILQLALGDKASMLRLQNNPVSQSAFNRIIANGDPGPFIDVRVTTLDNALEEQRARPSFIKCDAEGFELAIIDGGTRCLRENAPVLVLEADMAEEDGMPSPRAFDLAKHLERLGYSAYNFDYDGALRVAPLGQMSVHHANVLFLPHRSPVHETLGLQEH